MFSTNARKVVTIALAGALVAGITSAGMADRQWEKGHPRRDQVNDHLQNQNKRILQQVKEGKMSKAQAAPLHREDHAIRKEGQRMAARNSGHITKADQAKLNRQEDAVSTRIGQ